MNLLASMILSIAAISADPSAHTGNRHDAITVQITSDKPITFTAEKLGKLARAKVEAGKDKDQQTYEGVPLADILHAAGVTWGAKCSLWLDCYVIVEGADGYRVVFSIPEIDPGLAHQAVLIADRCDGQPLSKAVGPYQVVEENARQRGRWVRQVTAIQVRMASDE
jgi:DMSO/TMAO reductase YedYZ molybdopterin-dependent catalytic subunit